jgi:cardiolipin synthase
VAEKKSTRDSLNRRLQLVPKEQRPAAQATAEGVLEDEFRKSKALRIVAVVAILIVVSWFLLALFQPGLDYKFDQPIGYAPESQEFLRELEALTDARVSPRTGVDVLANGEVYYPAELDAIKKAQHSITLEAYIFHKGEMAQKFVDALAAKAKTGVHVNIVVDAVGSFSTPKNYFKTIRDAGGQMEWYHPMRWNSIFRSNNRTHRELLVVDGTTAFIGGAGIADHWVISKKKDPRWRDNMYRIRGDAVAGLQGTFVENWLEASGKIISGKDYFPFTPDGGAAPALVVNSSPSSGLSTRARILFQALVAASRKSLVITTPYFLPDDSLRDELLQARARGVDVRILVPGAKSDHSMTRSSSRSKYGPLLQAGAKIYEYAPAMIHQKLLIVDGTWVVVGSTNFDSRSFGLNDEINLATRDTALAARLMTDYEHDVSQSELVSYEKWKRRPVWERGQEWFGWIIERQQ